MCRHPPVRPHFAAVAGGRQMGSAHIQLNSNTCIALSCCLSSFLPSFALRIKALAPYSRALLLYSALRLLLHVLYQHSLFLFVRWLPNPENCVLSAFHLFVYSISWDHIKLPSQSQYFKNGRMELLNTCDPLKSPMEVEKSVLRKVATLQHLLCFRRTDRASQARKERSSGCHPTKGLDIVSLISKN
jgi:hypothetical protein